MATPLPLSDEQKAAAGPKFYDPPTGVYREATEPEQMTECRYYEQQFPDVETLVMVNVKKVEALGAYVSLMEYNNTEGMVLLSELSRRRIRSINKLIRVGRQEVVLVLRVDKEKGYVDLSKRRVPSEDIAKFTARYNKSKAVNSVLYNVAKVCKVHLSDLYRNIAWPLYAKYGHAYDGFKLAVSDPGTVFEGLEIPERIMKALMKDVSRKLAAKASKVRADIELTCFTMEGIDAIKAALIAGKNEDPKSNISIKLVAPPLYVMTMQAVDKKMGIESLNRAIAKVTEVITAKGGRINVKHAPHGTDDESEAELAEQMAALAKANAEVDGDADNE